MCSMNAATSEPRKFSPSPSPTTSGLLRRAATTRSGSSASIATRVKAPSSTWQTRCIAVVRSTPGLELQLDEVGDGLGVGLGDEHVVVGLEAGAQVGEVLDDPVVHQRDPVGVAGVRVGVDVVGRAVGGPAGVPDARCGTAAAPASAMTFSRLASLPAFFAVAIAPDRPSWTVGAPPGTTSATPAESYPRYSNRRSPSITTPWACWWPTYPTMPHMGRDSTGHGPRSRAGGRAARIAGHVAGRWPSRVADQAGPRFSPRVPQRLPRARRQRARGFAVHRARPQRLGQAGSREQQPAQRRARSPACAAWATASTSRRSRRSTSRSPACSACTSRRPATCTASRRSSCTSRRRRARRS